MAQRTAVEVTDLLHRAEASDRLFEPVIDGWVAWVLMRFASANLMEHQGAISAPGRSPPVLEIPRLVLGDLVGLATLEPRKLLVMTDVANLQVVTDAGFKDAFFDDVLAGFDSWIKVDHVRGSTFVARRPRALHPPKFSTTAFSVVAETLTRIGLPRHAAAAGKALYERMREAFGESVLGVDFITARLRRFHRVRRLWGRVLARLRPQCVLVADHGHFALVAAAREAGVPVIELQHGWIPRDHHAYSWPASARPHRARMPIADRLLVHGPAAREVLESHGFFTGSIRVGGNTQVDGYRNRPRPDRTGPPRILFTTQGIDVDPILELLAAFLSRTPDPLQLFVKLHPVYEPAPERYVRALAGDPRVRIVLADEAPSTMDLLCQAHLHLSISSSCHHDALALGVPTAVLKFTTHDLMLPLVSSGAATLIASADELTALVRRAHELVVSDEIAGHQYAPGAVENIRAGIEEMIAERRRG